MVDTIGAALSGVIKESDLRLLRQYTEEKEMYESFQKQCLSYMQELADSCYPQEYELLKTIPGMKDINALCILAEVGADMSNFETASKLVGWAGLKPRNDESNKKVKSRKILKGNKYLRTALIQAAWPAVRTKGSGFKHKYTLLRARHMKEQKALVAIARKMMIIIWHILSKKKPYDPTRFLTKSMISKKAG